MKRYFFYEQEQQSLMDVYESVYRPRVKALPVISEAIDHGIKSVKIFTQQPGRGADLTFHGRSVAVLSDDGDQGMVLNAMDNEHTVQVITTKEGAQVKIVGQDGLVVDEFVTKIAPRYGDGEITIININEL